MSDGMRELAPSRAMIGAAVLGSVNLALGTAATIARRVLAAACRYRAHAALSSLSDYQLARIGIQRRLIPAFAASLASPDGARARRGGPLAAPGWNGRGATPP